MSEIQAAMYARVSSDRQVSEHTIASQVAALQERVAADGLRLPADLQFIDDGYSGSTLLRPALERLRDAAAAGRIDRLYVHAPTVWHEAMRIRSSWSRNCAPVGWSWCC